MIPSMIRAVAILVYLGSHGLASAPSIPVLTPPSNAVWQPISNSTGAQNITFSHTPENVSTVATLDTNSDPPDEGYTIHAYGSPISVVFSVYRPLIPGPALFATYYWVGLEALSKGTRQITESHSWKWEARLYLWPRPGMTWDIFATAILILDQFARTKGPWGFRFDIYHQSRGAVGQGIVFGEIPERGLVASS